MATPTAEDQPESPHAPFLALLSSTTEVLQRPLESGQCTSIAFTERLEQGRIRTSVGAVGSSYDNVLTETINGLYKTGVIKSRGPWRSLEQGEFATAG